MTVTFCRGGCGTPLVGMYAETCRKCVRRAASRSRTRFAVLAPAPTIAPPNGKIERLLATMDARRRHERWQG